MHLSRGGLDNAEVFRGSNEVAFGALGPLSAFWVPPCGHTAGSMLLMLGVGLDAVCLREKKVL